MPSPPLVLRAWSRLSRLPLGKRTFSRMVAAKAPYFRSVDPLIEELAPGRCVASLKKRWRVTNHIGTVHAIAMCNLVEFAGGLMTEASVPPTTHRWIPKGMTVEYLRKAETDLRASCVCDPLPVFGSEGFDWPVTVSVEDLRAQVVLLAVIKMWISPKP